eukprot:1415886-Pyramimonas_sp.AAC.1
MLPPGTQAKAKHTDVLSLGARMRTLPTLKGEAHLCSCSTRGSSRRSNRSSSSSSSSRRRRRRSSSSGVVAV